ncbi:energy transducer TonB [Sulfurospirillum cavolei]|uniref:energy transducer TonB n=1 Tax=Sulfurospirillum cavolei TaxID=366522 RepID=UPI0005A71926|nr:energy transducer TonB [Sulfurospirillum cavolei]
MKRYLNALSITLLIYTCIGYVLLYQRTLQPLSAPVSETTYISVFIQKTPPKQEAPSVAPTPPEPIKQDVPKPKTIAKATTPKIKQPTAIPLPKEPSIDETVAKNDLKEVPQKESIQNETAVSSPPKGKNDAMQAYIKRVVARINEHKIYPKIAQKSHIEGNVIVEFTISPTGELLSLTIIEGKKIFYKATEEAFYKSFPCPLEERWLTSDTTFRIALNYTLL